MTITDLERELLKVATAPVLIPWRVAGIWHARLIDIDRPEMSGLGMGETMGAAIQGAIVEFRCRLAIGIAHEMDESEMSFVEPRHEHAELGGES